ncbi:MAG TPA: hypothetical protein VMV10_15585 [Pirellulales bacterium]|nr:hypothetical protein [Pirellulales bacterium]
MHGRELVELAALASAHGLVLIRNDDASLPIEGLGQYWSASKCRLDRWSRALKAAVPSAPEISTPEISRLERLTQSPDGAAAPSYDASLKSVLEEILLSEVLTRVWTALMAAFDERHGQTENAPVAESVLAGHAEARHGALTLLVQGPGVSSRDALALNQLRRRAERWTDLLVGHICLEHDVSRFAANPETAREFAADLRHHQAWSADNQAWPIMLASLRAAFRQKSSSASPNGDLNQRIAAGVLACLPPELFDATGLVQSLWMTRISRAADDAQGLISAMFAPEPCPGVNRDNPDLASELRRKPDRRR